VLALLELVETQEWVLCIRIQLILDRKHIVTLVAHIVHIWRSKKLTKIKVQQLLSLEIDGPYLRVQTRVEMQSSLGVSGRRERRKDVLFHALLAINSFHRRYFKILLVCVLLRLVHLLDRMLLGLWLILLLL
jgi:hypothetical protein